jgi:hypothetical protein
MHRNSTLFLLLLWGLPLSVAESKSGIEYRKVVLETTDFQWKKPEGLTFDKEGYAVFRFNVSVSTDGKVTDVVLTEGAPGPSSDQLKAQILSFTYKPQIRYFKAVASEITETVWFSARPDMPTYPGIVSLCKVKPVKRRDASIYYPSRLRVGGSTIIRFEITPEGKVENEKSIEFTNVLFATQARLGIREMLFEPVIENGKPIRCYDFYHVSFKPQ